MRQIMKVGLAALGVALLLPISAYAQTGAISGKVEDAGGGALPGVTVEVSSPALIEKVRSSVTENDGRYQITALPVGKYTVTFKLMGFSDLSRANVDITSDFTAPVNAVMKVGGVNTTVNVVAEAPVVDVNNARVQQVFQGEDIANLPTQRDIPSVLLLVPSLTSDPTRGSCNGGVGIFCNPTVPTFNSHTSALDLDGQNQGRIMVDGMVINRGGAGSGINTNTGIANGIVLDTAAAQEVSFTLSGSLGESETGGASINLVPRTGGNRYAGSFFTSYTGTGMFDRNRDTRLTENQDIQEYNYDFDVNGSFGGPVMKDRLWFYFYARQRGNDQYPNGGAAPGFSNLNEGKFAANYVPNRDNGWLTFSNEYKNASVRITYQATQKNKFNIYWDEQDSCTNPCYGMINLVDSPEAYFSLMSRPNRLMQLSWTNPFTNRLLFDAGVTYIPTHQDTTKHREYPNYHAIPRVCESGPTVGRDEFAIKYYVGVSNSQSGTGLCDIFTTMNSGSINDQFPGGTYTLTNDDTVRSRARASYITGSHNAAIGFEGAWFTEKIRNEVNDMRLSYHYQTPLRATTGTWNEANRSGPCNLAPATSVLPCGNMSLYYPEDLANSLDRPKPVSFQMVTGVSTTDETVWFGALYIQDQWTLNRFTLNGALRYDHAESGYGSSCIGPDVFVPTGQIIGPTGALLADAQPGGQWCSKAQKATHYNDITPRWGVAWDVFGNGKTSVKWNMGKYLGAAGFGGLYTGFNDARRSTNTITRRWDDINGNRLVECDFFNYNVHTSPQGDFCGPLADANGNPTTGFVTYGREPNQNALANANSSCGLKNAPVLQVRYCEAAGQDMMQGWGMRRYEWQFGLGVQHELLPRVSVEVTYNRRYYGNQTDQDTVNFQCDYYTNFEGSTIQGTAYEDWHTCPNQYMQYTSQYADFYNVTVPVDPRLPNGGGYRIQGLNTGKLGVTAPTGGGAVTLIRDELAYSWNGVDTNFVFRARGGLRISGGTSTGRSNRDTCFIDTDNPNVKGREGNDFGGGCRPYNPFNTNVRANAAYTIPWVDLLVGTVFQYRPGVVRSANMNFTYADVNWEPNSQYRSGTQFGSLGTTQGGSTNLLDTGDIYGEGFRQWDLNFGKNFRFGRRRINVGVNVYNLFNTDAATGYNSTYTAFRQADNSWVTDNPSTPAVEVNNWGQVTNIASPRFLRFTVQFDF